MRHDLEVRNDRAATTKRARNRLAAIVASLAVAGAASVALAGAAAAQPGPGTIRDRCFPGHFCAYDNANFNVKLLDSTVPCNTHRVDVADDRVSSVRNLTNNAWWGINALRGRPDRVLIKIAPHTELAYVGDPANDKIDHFDVHC